jgi:hypothetical protein
MADRVDGAVPMTDDRSPVVIESAEAQQASPRAEVAGSKRLETVDALRGLAALSVCWYGRRDGVA